MKERHLFPFILYALVAVVALTPFVSYSSGFTLTVTVCNGSDCGSSAPNPSGGAPTGTLGAGTTQATLTLNTDVAATCKYATAAGVSYSNLPNVFATTGGTSHATVVTGLTNGNTYAYYVRCANLSNIPMTNDYVISFSIATPSNAGGGGGGGGGGGVYSAPSIPTTVSFSGLAYPNTAVTLLKDGQLVATQPAGPDARFNISISGLAAGVYTFSVIATDSQGRKSNPYSFTETVTDGASTIVSGIFLPPTIGVDKVEVKRGDPITMFGETVPSAQVTVSIHSANEIDKTVSPDTNGLWSYVLNSLELDDGTHTTQAFAATSSSASPLSAIAQFTVGDKNVSAPSSATPIGDLNGDGHVNIIDFSIMAYWVGRTLTPEAEATVDLDHSGRIDLRDFSILAYHWTG